VVLEKELLKRFGVKICINNIIQKEIIMKSFRQHLGKDDIDQELVENITQILFLQEYGDEIFEDEILSEGKIDDLLKKTGLHIHKSRGIISYLKSANLGVAKMMIAAIKGDKEGIKEVVKSVKKEDVLDFLLKLDMATNHTITAPIHMIDAWTGWHLWAAIQEKTAKVGDYIKTIKDAVMVVKNNLIKTLDKKHVVYHNKRLTALIQDVESKKFSPALNTVK